MDVITITVTELKKIADDKIIVIDSFHYKLKKPKPVNPTKKKKYMDKRKETNRQLVKNYNKIVDNEYEYTGEYRTFTLMKLKANLFDTYFDEL